jgi:hypothetical protein
MVYSTVQCVDGLSLGTGSLGSWSLGTVGSLHGGLNNCGESLGGRPPDSRWKGTV